MTLTVSTDNRLSSENPKGVRLMEACYPIAIAGSRPAYRGDTLWTIDGDEIVRFEAGAYFSDLPGSVFFVTLGKKWFAPHCYQSYEDARDKLMRQLFDTHKALEDRIEVLLNRIAELQSEAGRS